MAINSRRWLLIFGPLLIVLTVSAMLSGVVGNIQSRGYDVIFRGKSLSGNYTTFSGKSVQSCGALCASRECWVFTWNNESRECRLLDPLNSFPSIVDDSPTLRTYFSSTTNDAKYVMLPTEITWPECKLECEKLGGRLAIPPDYSYGALLHIIHGTDRFHVGIYRDINDEDTWYNMKGQVLSPLPFQWKNGEPSNNYGKQYVMLMVNGQLADIFDDKDFSCVCEKYLNHH